MPCDEKTHQKRQRDVYVQLLIAMLGGEVDEDFLRFVPLSPDVKHNPTLIANAVDTPWISNDEMDKLRSLNSITFLHCEILYFCRLMSLTEEEQRTRELAIAEISKIGNFSPFFSFALDCKC